MDVYCMAASVCLSFPSRRPLVFFILCGKTKDDEMLDCTQLQLRQRPIVKCSSLCLSLTLCSHNHPVSCCSIQTKSFVLLNTLLLRARSRIFAPFPQNVLPTMIFKSLTNRRTIRFLRLVDPLDACGLSFSSFPNNNIQNCSHYCLLQENSREDVTVHVLVVGMLTIMAWTVKCCRVCPCVALVCTSMDNG